MKKLILATALGAFVMLAGCKKEAATNGTDITGNWVGIYNGPAYGSPSQIVVSKAGDSTVRIDIKLTEDSYQYTATTLQNVKVSGSGGIVNEQDNIIEYTNLGEYNFKGSLSLSGSGHVIMNVTAESVAANNENSPLNFAFAGNKVQ